MFTSSAIVVVLILLAAVGALLVAIGLRGKRRGNELYCRKCDYDVRGLPGQRCPECGAALDVRRATVRGRRVTRFGALTTGIILVVVGLAPLVSDIREALQKHNWFGLNPLYLLLDEALSENEVGAERALYELGRRLRDGRLSAEETARVADAALTVQARPDMLKRLRNPLLALLDRLYKGNHLSDEQLHRFRANGQVISVDVRPNAVAGYRVPVRIRRQGRLPVPLASNAQLRALRFNGQPVTIDAERWELPGGANTKEVCHYLTPTRAGKNTVECEVALRVYNWDEWVERDMRRPPKGGPVYDFIKTVSAEFEVLAEMPDSYITLVSSPDVERAVRRAISVRGVEVALDLDPRTRRGPEVLRAEFHVSGRLPANVAFQVIARFDGRRMVLGPLTIHEGEYAPYHSFEISHEFTGRPIPKELDLQLESSETAAMETLDMYEIWSGELEFRNVPVSKR